MVDQSEAEVGLMSVESGLILGPGVAQRQSAGLMKGTLSKFDSRQERREKFLLQGQLKFCAGSYFGIRSNPVLPQ